MRRGGVRSQEWVAAGLVLAASSLGAWRVTVDARSLDASTEVRRGQVERLVEWSQAPQLPAGAAAALKGVFPGHDVSIAEAPWGAHLALSAADPVRMP